MGFMTVSRIAARLLPQSEADDAAFLREKPDRIVLAPDPGLTPSDKPPVRLFLGTEPGQYRAERVFVWSIEQVRDRSRRYEIYLMKDLEGFDRRLWLTGFTNYRLAIPHLAGKTGRAIYNDVDQHFLSDPAELFDIDMGESGFLALSPQDTAVMLIDCERMASVWTLRDAQHGRRKPLEAKARHMCGQLPREWHCRDWEYVEGKSKCMHYTTIHTQPWQPFPSVFVYQPNEAAHVWDADERAADEARYQPFTLAEPSMGFVKVVEQRRTSARALPSRNGSVDSPGVQDLVTACAAQTIFELSLAARAGDATAVEPLSDKRSGLNVTRYNALDEAPAPGGEYDGVVCTDTLEHVCDDDVFWLLDDLFRRARGFVHVTVRQETAGSLLSQFGRQRRSSRAPAWWYDRFREAGQRYPEVHWKLDLTVTSKSGVSQSYQREGGRRNDGPPRVWVLLDHKPGHTTQSLGLVKALGWPYEIKTIDFSPLNLATDRLVHPMLIDPGGKRRDALRAPWPDVVVSTGWRTVPLTRWIAEQSGGATRTVQMGRKGGDVAQHYDAVVTCSHLRLPTNPHRIETLAPLSRVNADALAEAAARFPDLFGSAPHPWIVLLVGGTSRHHRIDTAMARRMGEEVGSFAREAGGTVFAVTSRRTGAEVEAALEAGLGSTGRMCRWANVGNDNPYLGYLAGADAVVVTGDSESMLAEASASGKPVYIYPAVKRASSPAARLAEFVTRIAYSRPLKRKGTVRPQQGREYLCSRLIERGIIRPPRDVELMCRLLVEQGAARRFGDSLGTADGRPLSENEQAAEKVRALLGWTLWDDQPEATSVGRGQARRRTATA